MSGRDRGLADSAGISRIVSDREILVLTGTGGVGKTTIAAVMALEAAMRGRRVALVTIDPAKRLADALGIEELGNQPSAIELGDISGHLVAMMLDTKSTFDELVVRHAPTPEQAQRILANNFYSNISNALSGTQEYMAMEKLYELTMSGDYDLVVVDTPPSRNALAFLDSPNLLARLIDHWLYRALMTPTRRLLRASQILLRQLSKIVGGEVVEDVVAFFQAFEGMEAGFKERSQKVMELLGSDACSFVLVASARRDTTIEAVYFADQLTRNNLAIDAVVMNRLQPDIIRLTRRPRAPEFVPFLRAHDELHALADREGTHIASLLSQIEGDPVMVRVPLLDSDVHDLTSLERLRALLFV
ncbi:MAG: ArsA-related P-loop ATPase [Acidimicrobiales bacterium]